MKPVTGEGAPWYASGVHMWNGTAATLKPSPMIRKPTATTSKPTSVGGVVVRYCTMPSSFPEPSKPYRFVDPVTPYTRAMPRRKNADENAPRRKYFMADSWLNNEHVRKPTRT